MACAGPVFVPLQGLKAPLRGFRDPFRGQAVEGKAMQRIRMVGALLLPALLLASCANAARPSATPTAVQAAETAAIPTASSAPAAWPTQESPAYDLGPASDLSSLDSYAMHYVFHWESQRAGEKQQGFWDMWGQFSREPPIRRLVWTGSESGEQKQELLQIGTQLYINTDSGYMVLNSTEADIFQDNPLLHAPLDLVQGARGTLFEEKVVINGRLANGYLLEESALQTAPGMGTIARASGEVWVSQELNVVVRYMLHYEGQDLAVGGGEEGVLDLTFDLLAINEPVAIALPPTPTAVSP